MFRKSTILVIDDDSESVALVKKLLADVGCTRILTSSDPRNALSMYLDGTPDLVLLDLHMPAMSGVEFMHKCRRLDPAGEFVPVIVITADLSIQAKREALEAGANDFIDKFSEDFEILLRIKNFLRTRHLHLSIHTQNLDLEQQVYERTKDLKASEEEVVQRLAMASEYRDDVTGKHVQRVGNLAAELALAIGMENDIVELVRLAAKLHDIGKIAIPDSILYKPGALTHDERKVMKTHTRIGDQILSKGSSELIRTAQTIARSHHEKWDGTGYPDGLSGADIPTVGRIVAVADVYDALVTKRPYKEALPHAIARRTILEERGRHFDPKLIDAFSTIPYMKLMELANEHEPALTGEQPRRKARTRAKPKSVDAIRIVPISADENGKVKRDGSGGLTEKTVAEPLKGHFSQTSRGATQKPAHS